MKRELWVVEKLYRDGWEPDTTVYTPRMAQQVKKQREHSCPALDFRVTRYTPEEDTQ